MEDVFGSGVLPGRNVAVEDDIILIADEALLSVPSFILVQLVNLLSQSVNMRSRDHRSSSSYSTASSYF